MSKNILQVFTDNPIVTNQGTDLMYFGRAPYGIGDDTAMQFSDFAAQFGASYTASSLTKTDDTNVTLSLSGSPLTALLQSVSLTLGWTGQLSVPRGGTGNSSFTAYSVICGGVTSTGALQSVASLGNTGEILTSNGPGQLPTWQAGAVITPAAMTKVDDTNVTLTLGGSPNTSLLAATSLTLGWTGLLSSARGGTGVNNGTSTLTLGGSLTTSGAFTSTFTMTGNTSVTFPTTGTLATTATASGIVNSGTINELAWYAANGSTISGLATAADGVLVTSAGSVPSISSTLPANLTIPTPRIAQINDTSGNAMFVMNLNASAVNNWAISNSSTGSPLQFAAIGSDTNISTQFLTKGTGAHSFFSSNTTIPMIWNTGTTNQHVTNWVISDTSATRNVTLQDASGTLAFLTDRNFVLLGTATANNTSQFVTFTNIPTTYTNLMLMWSGVSPATDGAVFGIQGSTDNGSSFLNTSGNYNVQALLASSTAVTASSSNAIGYYPLTTTVTNTSPGTLGSNGFCYLTNATVATRTGMQSKSWYVIQTSSAQGSYDAVGQIAVASVLNAIAFVATAGNVATGSFQLYGLS